MFEMYVLNHGIRPGMAHDTSVHDFDSAVQHELNKHIAEGADSVRRWLDLWMHDTYPSKGECEGACSGARGVDPSAIFRAGYDASQANHD
jgi:hypothetical protein